VSAHGVSCAGDLDVDQTDALRIMAIAAAILALGLGYWLIRDSDQRLGEVA
jgi:hypothetical protein